MQSKTNELELSTIEVEHRLFEAIRNKDDDALSQLLADDFVFRGPGQPEMGKVEFRESVKSFPLEILDIWSDDMKVNLYGDLAVLTGVQQARTRDESGAEQLSAGAFSDVFAKRDGRWLLVLAYNVDLPAPDSSSSSD